MTALSKREGIDGSLIDRRPLLDGREAVTTSVPVDLDGASAAISVPAPRLGEPNRFTWVMATTGLALPWPNDDFLDIDEVPDASFDRPARWPGGT